MSGPQLLESGMGRFMAVIGTSVCPMTCLIGDYKRPSVPSRCLDHRSGERVKSVCSNPKLLRRARREWYLVSLPPSSREFFIPTDKYDMASFHKYIIEHNRELFSQDKKFKWIKVHGVRTLENQWQSKLRPYFQRDLGDFWHIRIPIGYQAQRKVDFYVTSYTPKLLLFYSASTYWEYEKTLRQFISNTSGQGMMWIGPKKYEDLILHIMDKFRPTLRKFRARRSEGDTTSSEVRPNVNRVMYYSARDSFQTLNELKARYGIRPTSVTFRIEGEEIQITNDGLFSLTRQSKGLFRVLEDSLDFIKVSESKLTTTAQDVKKEFEVIKMPAGNLKLPSLTSASISLKTRTLDSEAVDKFVANSKRFEFLGSFRKEGSFSWTATSLDKDKKSIFGIDSNENTIDLIPRTDTTFESILDFYRLVLEQVDDTATISVFGG